MRNLVEFAFIPDGGQTGSLVRSINWVGHPLGKPSEWPVLLKNTLGILFGSRHPMFLFWGPDLYCFYNDAYLPSFGKGKHPTAMGQRGIDCWPEIWPVISPQIDAALKNSKASWNENPWVPIFRKGQLEKVYWTYSYSPVIEVNGRVDGVLVVCTETTHEVTINRALREREVALLESQQNLILARQELHDFLMQTPVPLVLLRGPEHLITFANPPYEKLMGRPIIGKTLCQAFTVEEVGYFIPLLDKVYRTGEPFTGREVPLELLDERGNIPQQWIDISYHPFRDENGHIKGVLAFVVEVTHQVNARKAIEAAARDLTVERHKFESIFIESPAAMALQRGPDFIFEKINPEYKTMLGGRDLVGKSFLEALPELVGQPFHQLMQKVFKTGDPYVAREMKAQVIIQSGGSPEEAYFDFTYSRLSDDQGQPYGIYVHAMNVTDKVVAREKLITALKARDELLSICSHELRTPVSRMKLATQTFKRGLEKGDPKITSPERLAWMVEQSDRQLDWLNRLVEEMLDFSRISGGRLQISPTFCDLTEIVAETVDRMQPQFEAAGSIIHVSIATSIAGEWDRFRLEQVITNLLTHALKYGGGKPVDLTLTDTKDHAVISVRDEGLGIAEADLSRIFMPYERAVSISNMSGLGLGLYISRQIIEVHGGSITVESKSGSGSTFIVTLPKVNKPQTLKQYFYDS